jgi:hypothetical protein
MCAGLTGTLYDAELKRQGLGEDDACVGTACFRTAFVVLSCLGVVAMVCAALIWSRNHR